MKVIYTKHTIIILIILFIWEHIFQVNNISIRPTYPLAKLVLASETFFYYLGIFFGRIGSLITYLHLDKLIDTITYICSLIIDLFMSFKYIRLGIIYVSTLFDNNYQVYGASTFLCAVTLSSSSFVISHIVYTKKFSPRMMFYDTYFLIKYVYSLVLEAMNHSNHACYN